MASKGERKNRQDKRRERRRRERAAIAPRAVEGAPVEPPRRRMSETLGDFAQPLLSRLSPEAETAEGWYPEVLLASFVWNSVVAGRSDEAIVAEAARLLPRGDIVPVVVELIARKKTLFGDDLRRVMGVETYERGERIHIVALSVRQTE